jgi:hypothetical protein
VLALNAPEIAYENVSGMKNIDQSRSETQKDNNLNHTSGRHYKIETARPPWSVGTRVVDDGDLAGVLHDLFHCLKIHHGPFDLGKGAMNATKTGENKGQTSDMRYASTITHKKRAHTRKLE